MWDRQNGPIVRSSFQQADATATQFNYALVQQGTVPSARLAFATDASNNDTIAIGGKTFKFVTTLGAAAAQVQVKRGTDAATTLAALVKAVNGTTSSTEWVEATTAFAVSVLADAVDSTHLRLRYATSRGGSPLAGSSGSIALSESLTPAGDIWNCANLNVSSGSTSKSLCSRGAFTVTAAMITYGSYQLELPFTPTTFTTSVLDSTGVLRSSNEAVVISSAALSFTMAGGASPNLQTGDVVTYFAME